MNFVWTFGESLQKPQLKLVPAPYGSPRLPATPQRRQQQQVVGEVASEFHEETETHFLDDLKSYLKRLSTCLFWSPASWDGNQIKWSSQTKW